MSSWQALLTIVFVQALVNTFGIAVYNSIRGTSKKPFSVHSNRYVRFFFAAINFIALFCLVKFGFHSVLVFFVMMGLYLISQRIVDDYCVI